MRESVMLRRFSSVANSNDSSSDNNVVSADNTSKERKVRKRKVVKAKTNNTAYVADVLPEEAETVTDKNVANVLHFFNTCDHVTLRKLKALKSAFFKGVELGKVIQTGIVSKRFENIDSLLTILPLELSAVPELAKLIQKLGRQEQSQLGLKRLHPDLPLKHLKKVKRVVAVDVFQNQVAWVVETQDRVVTDAGHHVMFGEKFKFVYNHVQHQQELHAVLRMIPEADVYLMHSRRIIKPVHKSQQKYAIHQGIIEALLVTLLNSRQQLASSCVGSDLLEQRLLNTSGTRMQEPVGSNTQKHAGSEVMEPADTTITESDDKIQEPTIGRTLTNNDTAVNYVYMLDKAAFEDFYDDILLGSELLSCRGVVQNWLDGSGPLQGLVSDITDDDFKELLKGSEGEQMSKCLLMADMFCKCIQRTGKQFPRQYSLDENSNS